MKFAPLIEKLTTASTEAQLRSCFMDYAGEFVGATAWGLDFLDRQFQVIDSDLRGLPDTFRDRYQDVGRQADLVSQQMIQQQVPVHHLSVQSLTEWHQSPLYQDVCCSYGIEHGMVAPLFGSGRLIGGVYFMRGTDHAAFKDADLIHLSSLCQHLSVRFATIPSMSRSSFTNGLTPRELEIAELVAQGLNNRDIACRLNVSRDAVKQTLKRMFRKLDVSARAALVAKLKDKDLLR